MYRRTLVAGAPTRVIRNLQRFHENQSHEWPREASSGRTSNDHDMRWWPFYIQRQFMGCYTRAIALQLGCLQHASTCQANKTPTNTRTNHISNMSEIGLSHFKSLLKFEQTSDIS